VVKNPQGEWILRLTNDPFYRTLCKLFEKRKNLIWTGLLKNYSYIDERAREEFIIQLAKRNMYVIQLNKGQQERLKDLINNILEPLFHYITFFNNANIIRQFDDLWSAFKEFNETVAKTISAHISDNTLVFLHDYHHCLTPSFIYNSYKNIKNKKNLSIGMFIHSPFPAHDLFRRFPYREEILKSMMNCSLIGFHTFDSSRNFLTSCKRLLNIHYESNIKGDLALSFLGRNVVVRVRHVSSEPEIIKEEIQSPTFTRLYNELTTTYKDKYRFVSVDNLMFLTGVRHKLEGYRRLLRDIGDNYKQNIFIQYIYKDSTILSDGEMELIDEFRKSIMNLVESINKEFGECVIELRECYIDYQTRLAVLASGNCFVRTSKREAFYLDIYDFLNVKMMLNDLNDVTYILSELSGVTSSLGGAIKVNPFDVSLVFNF
jgi:trehalose 6-phosphate synthase